MEIEIDEEIYQFLRNRAEPFVDTPNSVLRKLLLDDHEENAMNRTSSAFTTPSAKTVGRNTDEFVASVLRKIGGDFKRRRPYRMMFESEDRLIYFQNFNMPGDRLWFRVSKNAWKTLKEATTRAEIYFTNPAERIAYAIPVADIENRVQSKGWNRDYLEVNIDRANSRWTGLNWSISEYLGSH
ncbi:MAG: hypothetical protein HN732_05100 [Rhodospirillaceae bacterium]|jgi:hypothetical protein|nr:hypothetical protein [Rhodospirillaceae bacterium]